MKETVATPAHDANFLHHLISPDRSYVTISMHGSSGLQNETFPNKVQAIFVKATNPACSFGESYMNNLE